MIRQEIVSGDVVMLKSGSPPLTVDSIDASGEAAWVVWFCDGKQQTSLLRLSNLVLLSDLESPSRVHAAPHRPSATAFPPARVDLPTSPDSGFAGFLRLLGMKA